VFAPPYLTSHLILITFVNSTQITAQLGYSVDIASPGMAADSADRPLKAFRIAGLPSDFYYMPNFISIEEEASILQKAR